MNIIFFIFIILVSILNKTLAKTVLVQILDAMARDFDKEANDKGGHDSSTSRGRSSFSDIISDQIFGGSYNPPSGHKDSYDKGWKNDQNQKK